MPSDNKKEKAIEWSARVLLTLHFIRSLSGIIIYWQTKWQLASPLIPKYITGEISEPYLKSSLVVGIAFVISLWFYFFRMRLVTISLSAVSILVFQLLSIYFAQ